MNGEMTFVTSKMTEKFEFWTKLKIKHFEKFKLIFEECVWGGEAPSKILFKYQIEQLKYFDFAVSFKIRTFLSFCSLKTWFVCSYIPISFISLSFNKFGKIINFSNFGIKFMLFFMWPEIRKYWSDRNEPKYGNGKQHFNFVFSWVKCPNSSFFARYSRELTYETWLDTP